MGALFRMLVPMATLAAGTWLGLGRPSAAQTRERAMEMIASARARVIPPSPSPSPASPPPPIDGGPPPFDPTRAPDPSNWPRLNPDARAERAWILAEGPVYPAHDGRRLVTFTFDDGPFPETTPTVLKLLDRHHVRATFFWIGRYLDGEDARAVESRKAAHAIVAAGHFIGNHTHDHVQISGVNRTRALSQIDDGAASIERAIGIRPFLFRPPYGLLTPWLEDAVKERGLELVLWNIAADDIERTDSDEIFDKIRDRLEYAEGGVVLLHDMHWPSVKALARLLAWLAHHKVDPKRPAARGYEIVDLPTFLRATAAAPQPYGSREELEKARRVAHGID